MAVGNAMGERDLVVERYTNYPEEKVWRHDTPTPLPVGAIHPDMYSSASLPMPSCADVKLHGNTLLSSSRGSCTSVWV